MIGNRVDRVVDRIFRMAEARRAAGSIVNALSSSWYRADNQSRFERTPREVARSAQDTGNYVPIAAGIN